MTDIAIIFRIGYKYELVYLEYFFIEKKLIIPKK